MTAKSPVEKARARLNEIGAQLKKLGATDAVLVRLRTGTDSVRQETAECLQLMAVDSKTVGEYLDEAHRFRSLVEAQSHYEIADFRHDRDAGE